VDGLECGSLKPNGAGREGLTPSASKTGNPSGGVSAADSRGAEESDARLSDEGKGFSLTRKGSFVTPTRKAQKKQKEVPVVGEVREGPKAEAVAVARRRRERERERERRCMRV
jgi:hypothetical protein